MSSASQGSNLYSATSILERTANRSFHEAEKKEIEWDTGSPAGVSFGKQWILYRDGGKLCLPVDVQSFDAVWKSLRSSSYNLDGYTCRAAVIRDKYGALLFHDDSKSDQADGSWKIVPTPFTADPIDLDKSDLENVSEPSKQLETFLKAPGSNLTPDMTSTYKLTFTASRSKPEMEVYVPFDTHWLDVADPSNADADLVMAVRDKDSKVDPDTDRWVAFYLLKHREGTA